MTELARQLQQIQVNSSHLPSRTQASFLFDIREASKIERDTIFAIGINGLDELRYKYTEFLTFYSNIFQEDFAEGHYFRDGLLPEQIDYLNLELPKVINMIAPYFLLQSTHKILEMLIRFYQINVHYVDCVIRAFIPYHDTKFFARLLQIMTIKGTYWEFLEKYQKEGYVISRRDIINRCISDSSLLNIILEIVNISPLHLRLTGVICLQIITTQQTLNENMLLNVMNLINHCIQSTSEGKSLAYSLLCCIAVKKKFTADYLNAIIFDCLRFADKEVQYALQCVLLLINVHRPNKLPNFVFNHLMEASVLKTLCQLSHKNDILSLLSLITKKCLGNLDVYQDNLLYIIQNAYLSNQSAQILLSQTLNSYINISKKKQGQFQDTFMQVLQEVSKNHLETITNAIPDILEKIQETHPGEETKNLVHQLISKALTDIPVDYASDLPMVLALTHKDLEIRRNAASNILDYLPQLENTILMLLQSEQDIDIMVQLLQYKELIQLDNQQLYDALYARLMEYLSWTNPPQYLIRSIFTWLTNNIVENNINTFQITPNHIKMIINSYEIPQLKDLTPLAVNSARTHILFKDYDGREFSKHITNAFIQYWFDANDVICNLFDCSLVVQLLPEVIIGISETQEVGLMEMLNTLTQITNFVLKNNRQDLTTILFTINEICPNLDSITEQENLQLATIMIQGILKFVLSIDMPFASAILQKHFSKNTLQCLLEVSQESCEALTTALALSSESFECYMEALGVILVNLSRSDPFRSSAILALEAFHKGKLETPLQIQVYNQGLINLDEQQQRAVKLFISKLVSYKVGIQQDPQYLSFILVKIFKLGLVEFISQTFKSLPYGRKDLINIFERVNNEELTEKFLDGQLDWEERILVFKRISISQIGKFIDTLLDWSYNAQIMDLLLQKLQQQLVQSLKKDQQLLLLQLFIYHLKSNDPDLSASIKQKFESLVFSEELIQRLLNEASQQELTIILELLQNYISGGTFTIYETLITLLNSLSSMTSTPSTEYLKQMVLINLRILQNTISKLPELSEQHLSIISSLLSSKTPQGLHTKHQALMTLASLAEQYPEEIMNWLIERFEISTIESAYDEVMMLKQTLQSIAPKLSEQCIDMSQLMRKFLDCLQAASVENKTKHIVDIVKAIGSHYLYQAVILLIEYKDNSIFLLLTKFSAEDQIALICNLLKAVLYDIQLQQVKQNWFSIMQILALIMEYFSDPLGYKAVDRALLLRLPDLREVIRFTLIIKSEMHRVKELRKSRNILKAVDQLCINLTSVIDEETLALTSAEILGDTENKATRRLKIEVLKLIEESVKDVKMYKKVASPVLGVLEANLHKLERTGEDKPKALIKYFVLLLKTLLVFVSRQVWEKERVIQVLFGYTNAKNIEIRALSIQCLTSVLREKTPENLPHIKHYVGCLLLAIQDSVNTPLIDPLLKCVQISIKSLQEFVNPHVKDIILLLLRIDQNVTKCLKTITHHIPIRTLIEQIPEIMQNDILHQAPLKVVAFMEGLFEMITFQDVKIYYKQLTEIVLQMFENIEDMENNNLMQFAEAAAQMYQKFAVNLNKMQLKHSFIAIYEWSSSNKDEYYERRLIILLEIIKQLCQTLKTIFVGFYPIFWDLLVDYLQVIYDKYSEITAKRKRGDKQLDIIICSQIARVITLCVENDNTNFVNFEKYDTLSQVLPQVFKAKGLKKNLRLLISDHLIPCIVKLFESTKDQAVWQAFNYRLLSNARNENKNIRYLTFTALSKIIDKLGGEISVLLSDIMPFITEGLEDDSAKVTNEAKNTMRKLEISCGGEVQQYLE